MGARDCSAAFVSTARTTPLEQPSRSEAMPHAPKMMDGLLLPKAEFPFCRHLKLYNSPTPNYEL